jgi:hypothetical protein
MIEMERVIITLRDSPYEHLKEKQKYRILKEVVTEKQMSVLNSKSQSIF